jgi:diadenylate cyclase
MPGRLDGLMGSALDLVAPGTELRQAIDSILAARTGALIVIGDPKELDPLSRGGFVLNAPFEAEMLSELSKMDGAIVLDEECVSIVRANVHMTPDPSLLTSETGIRHRTAEQVSRQTGALVIAVSKRRAIVTLFLDGKRLILEEVDVVLAKANQALQTLQRLRARLDEVSMRLTRLEFEDRVNLENVVTVLQQCEALLRVDMELDRYIVRLGNEGRLVSMQADELMTGVEEDYATLLADYSANRRRKPGRIRSDIGALTPDRLLEGATIAQTLGYPAAGEVLETHVRPRGYRLLNKIPNLPGAVVRRIVDKLGDFARIVEADEEDLEKVDGVGHRRAEAIRDGLRRMREYGTR